MQIGAKSQGRSGQEGVVLNRKTRTGQGHEVEISLCIQGQSQHHRHQRRGKEGREANERGGRLGGEGEEKN